LIYKKEPFAIPIKFWYSEGLCVFEKIMLLLLNIAGLANKKAACLCYLRVSTDSQANEGGIAQNQRSPSGKF